jgi:hypothetical protein
MGKFGPTEVRDCPMHRGKVPSEIMHGVMTTRLMCALVVPIGQGALENELAQKAAQALADRPLKLGAISAQLVESSVNNNHYAGHRDRWMDLPAAAMQLVFRSRHFVPTEPRRSATFIPRRGNQMLESQH